MRFPAILKELRERNKISQAALARQVGISQSLIAQFETGEKVPNAYVLLRIATYFHTTCEELIGEVEEEQTTSTPFLPQETFLLALKNKKPPKNAFIPSLENGSAVVMFETGDVYQLEKRPAGWVSKS